MARQYPTLTRNGFLLPERIKASYEGAGEGRRSASWDAPDVGINSINTPALRNLRARSRAAVRNDPYAFNVIDKRVSNLIGTGITPRPRSMTMPCVKCSRSCGRTGWTSRTPMA